MSHSYKHQILQHVKHRAYQPQSFKALADQLGVADQDRDAFKAALDELVSENQVILGSAGTIALPPPGRTMTGRFRLNQRGFGFVIPDTPNAHGDLFVPAGATNGALTGDMVRADVRRRGGFGGGSGGGKSPYIGVIVEILKRGESHFVGTLQRKGNTFLVIVDGTALAQPVVVRDPGAKHAAVGDKVVIELTRYPEDNALPEGVITEVIGKTGEADVETVAVCRAYDLAEHFPDKVIDNARQVVNRYNNNPESFFENRTDLRDTYIITIDPPTAQDFDDAISISRTDNGWELGVHIADVAAFVTPGSALDEEAYQRGNSTYLPQRVVPMLPEVLSNGLCSLQPNVPRLARSVFITYDDDGYPQSSRFARSVIHSAHRLTYIEAQALIDGDQKLAREHAKYDAPYTAELIEALSKMNELSQIIRARRMKQGMIVLALPEVELVYGEDGHVKDAQPEDDSYTHKLIEAFMVEANEAVARVFADLNVPLIRRIHPEPGAHDITELRTFARVAGFDIPMRPTRKDLQRLLEATRDTPAARAVHFAVLRTLTKAEYTPDLIGHFALASEHYTHFTSPIRRYPDLTVHRALDVLTQKLDEVGRVPRSPQKRKRLSNQLRSDERVPDADWLRQMGNHCSATERNSEAAERELRTLLVLHLLEKHIGDEFASTVTGATNFGVFCQIDKYLVEGLIRTDALPGAPAERWQLNPYTGSLVAQRSGRAIAIGDQYRVRVMGVDLAKRELNLMLLDTPSGRAAAAPVSPFRKRRKEKAKHSPARPAAHKPRRSKKRRR
ncbi:MAG: ribonuclease R [Planctomycetes bacterium]|nr:ribonuclease R [Planctomycetota bacterium]